MLSNSEKSKRFFGVTSVKLRWWCRHFIVQESDQKKFRQILDFLLYFTKISWNFTKFLRNTGRNQFHEILIFLRSDSEYKSNVGHKILPKRNKSTQDFAKKLASSWLLFFVTLFCTKVKKSCHRDNKKEDNEVSIFFHVSWGEVVWAAFGVTG